MNLAFLNQSLWPILLLATSALFIHLLSKTPAERLIFPAMQFIIQVEKQSSRSTYLKDILLLLIRTMLLLSFLVAVLLPFIQQKKFEKNTPNNKDLYILLDASASMLARSNGQKLFDLAKEKTAEIIKQQEGFFCHGITYFKPLTLKSIAQSVHLHESTISRVTNNKYMETPRGIFGLKHFFNTALESKIGLCHGTTFICSRIHVLVSREQTTHPLTDEKIAFILAKEGIDVARRTVAKYREALNIPPAFQRKREKNHPNLLLKVYLDIARKVTFFKNIVVLVSRFANN